MYFLPLKKTDHGTLRYTFWGRGEANWMQSWIRPLNWRTLLCHPEKSRIKRFSIAYQRECFRLIRFPDNICSTYCYHYNMQSFLVSWLNPLLMTKELVSQIGATRILQVIKIMIEIHGPRSRLQIQETRLACLPDPYLFFSKFVSGRNFKSYNLIGSVWRWSFSTIAPANPGGIMAWWTFQWLL